MTGPILIWVSCSAHVSALDVNHEKYVAHYSHTATEAKRIFSIRLTVTTGLLTDEFVQLE